VTDASILFDIKKGGIMHEMFQLPFAFTTSDLIANRELKNPPFSEFEKWGLSKEELSVAQVADMNLIRTSLKSLSINDISAFLLARDQKLTLLTGDDALRKFAESSGVEVHGILWILDELILNEIINKTEAAVALRQMMSHDRFLPKKECEDRLARWSSE